MLQDIIICTYNSNLLPERQTPGSACLDMKAAHSITIGPHEVVLLGAGMKTYIPEGRCARFYARSGLPTKMHLMQANNIAIMDADYRGEYLMQLYNYTTHPVEVTEGARICQLEFVPILHDGKRGTKHIPTISTVIDPDMYAEFDVRYPSQRGTGGIGSTGGHK